MLATIGAELKNTPCDVTLVLSNHFVRYTLVPENKSVSGAEEELAFARYCFNKIHGERSKGWEVRLTGSSSDPARVASAVDSGLLQAIRGCFPAGGKARLVSVQPYLMSAFNLCREIAGKYATWLLLIEPERACLACFEGGRWVAVRNVSDPQIKAEGTLQDQAKVAAQIYKGFGRWSSVCSAIVCWALIAAE